MDEARRGFTMTFDVNFDHLFQRYNPLVGPMIADYLLEEDANLERLVQMQYEEVPFSRVPREIDTQIAKFWTMVDYWLCPRKIYVVFWVRALIAHCCALEDVFQFQASVLKDPKIFYAGCVRLCRGLFGAASILKGDEGEETNYVTAYAEYGYRAAVDYWNNAVPTTDDSEDLQARVDMQRLEGVEFLRYLYTHVAHGTDLVHNLAKEDDQGTKFVRTETDADKYEEHLGQHVDLSKISKFLRYFSLIRPIAGVSDPVRKAIGLHNMDAPLDARSKNRWNAYLFYSGVGYRSEFGLGFIYDEYVKRLVLGLKPPTSAEIMKYHRGHEAYVDGDSMELYNYQLFRQLAKGEMFLEDVGGSKLLPKSGKGVSKVGVKLVSVSPDDVAREEAYDTGFFWIVGFLGLGGALFVSQRI